MDALADVLEPYKDLVGNFAALVGICPMLSGSFICWDIYKQENTRGVNIMTFLGGVVIGILFLRFSLIIGDDKMINMNIFAVALNFAYISVYFYYCEEKIKDWKQLVMAGLFTTVLMTYAQMEDPSLLEMRFGIIMTTLMFTLMAYPLFGLKDIIKNQSTEGLPFPMIVSGTVVTSTWLLYGIILRKMFIVIQHLIAFTLCAAQLSLFVIYPSKPKEKEKKAV